MTRRIGIDLETLDNSETAAIIAIGCVVYEDEHEISSCELLIDPEEAKKYGTTSPETLAWWDKQDPATKARMFSGQMTPHQAAYLVIEFFDALDTQSPKATVWANAPTFDCVILRHFFNKLAMRCPWHFSKERCLRTMFKLLPEELNRKFERTKPRVAHDAIEDVRAQMTSLFAVLRILKGI